MSIFNPTRFSNNTIPFLPSPPRREVKGHQQEPPCQSFAETNRIYPGVASMQHAPPGMWSYQAHDSVRTAGMIPSHNEARSKDFVHHQMIPRHYSTYPPEQFASAGPNFQGPLHYDPPHRYGWVTSPPQTLRKTDVHRDSDASNVSLHNPGFADSAVPTYRGHIKTSTDAILLLSACDLPDEPSAPSSAVNGTSVKPSPPPRRIHRRLLESERASLIRSGSVFAWDEAEAGMRRWTDGRCWSASRVSGCFLTYRELEVRKRSATDPNGPKANQYKIDGLIKQSFSITSASGRKLHIVSYYTKRDIRENRLRRVSEDPRFVGEAGGEWGLSVDEHELPDPEFETVATSAVHDEDRSSARSSVDGEEVSRKRSYPTTSGPASLWEGANKSQRYHMPRPSLPTDNSGLASQVQSRSGVQECAKRAKVEDQYPAFPSKAAKRARSSSPNALSLPNRMAPELPQIGFIASRRQSDDVSSRPANKLLTVSNIRGAGTQPTALQSPLTASLCEGSTPSGSEQDGAAGVLLSLRGGGSDDTLPRRLADSRDGSSRNSSYTALTTPEGSTSNTPPGLGSDSMKFAFQRPCGFDRMASDSDALRKLSVRL